MSLINQADVLGLMESQLEAKLAGEANISIENKHGELTVFLPLNLLVKLARTLRDDSDLRFVQLSDITAVDWLGRSPRFDMVYHLLSFETRVRLRLVVRVDEDQAVPSIHAVWPVANWFEREVWDMYGIAFEGHPDLRRILTDYGFVGHPQRKDFPLTGFVEMRYDPAAEKCIYEPVSLTQDFRQFDFESPWAGMTPQRREALQESLNQDAPAASGDDGQAGGAKDAGAKKAGA